MINLEGKTVIIAGGAGLIGKAIVRAIKEADGISIVADIAMHPCWDIMTNSGMALILESRPDIFINSAYPKDWINHLMGFLRCTEKMAQYMAENNGGSIVNIASIYGVVGAHYPSYEGTDMDMKPEYAAIEGGIIALSRTLATKYAKDGVRINCVSPGGVYDGQPDSFVKSYCNRVPMGRMATSEDIAGPVLFLASDLAKYVTGQNLIIDGGLTAW